MPVWSWFFIAAAVLIAFTLAWIAVLSVTGRKRTERLKKHFGPEYERAVGEAGDQRAGEHDLVARERKRQKLDIVVLSSEAHAMYAEHWRTVQAAFVDDPTKCVQKADALVAEVVEQLTAGFSEARSRLGAQWARGEDASMEDLRLALRRYREFFQRLAVWRRFHAGL